MIYEDYTQSYYYPYLEVLDRLELLRLGLINLSADNTMESEFSI